MSENINRLKKGEECWLDIEEIFLIYGDEVLNLFLSKVAYKWGMFRWFFPYSNILILAAYL